MDCDILKLRKILKLLHPNPPFPDLKKKSKVSELFIHGMLKKRTLKINILRDKIGAGVRERISDTKSIAQESFK